MLLLVHSIQMYANRLNLTCPGLYAQTLLTVVELPCLGALLLIMLLLILIIKHVHLFIAFLDF